MLTIALDSITLPLQTLLIMSTSRTFEELEGQEKDLLLKAPAIVSLLAASLDHNITKAEIDDAIELAHLRTFTSSKLLQPYYQAVEKNFKSTLTALMSRYLPMNAYSEEYFQEQINQINQLLGTIDPIFARALKESLNSYARHVNNSDKNFVEYFLVPINTPGILDGE